MNSSSPKLVRLAGLAVLAATVLAGPGRSSEERLDPEAAPSICYYFDWINSQYEGSTETETLANLEFFQWLHDEYGMVLDVYLLDVGNIDDGPFTAGVGRLIPGHYGSPASIEFRRQFPRGFAPIAAKARSFGCRLGIWLGPDGFGDMPEDEKARTEMLVALCRDHDFRLLKFDAVAGGLRPEKRAAFANAVARCREHCPDLIVLNERVDLGEAAGSATTNLWEGAETYIDVFSWNDRTAPHHRAGALARGLPPGLTRRLEDHGVCLSSCLDFWEDDLVLQAFNRCLIPAPEIYGNPWLLRDDELPRLARLCNMHRRFREILVDGIVLPESTYGPHAVSRGDDATRFITLRNLTWQPVSCMLKLDGSIGLSAANAVVLRRLHPAERILGRFPYGSEVPVEVAPFRSCLIAACAAPSREVADLAAFGGDVEILGCDFEVVRDVPGRPVVIKLLGLPGTESDIRLVSGNRAFHEALLDGRALPRFTAGSMARVAFAGERLRKPWHRMIGALAPCGVPADAGALYEAACFATDSNALEVRSLLRSGPTRIPQVDRARRAFFDQPMFVRRGIWDKNLFDGDEDTFFQARQRGGLLRVDFGEPVVMDTLAIRVKSRHERYINDELHGFAEDNRVEISSDLQTWTEAASFSGAGSCGVARIPAGRPVRYLRVFGAPARIAEIEASLQSRPLDRSGWRASNLLGAYADMPAVAAWSLTFDLDEVAENSYLALALPGRHGSEGACAVLRRRGGAIGAPDRSVSFPSNTWEYKNVESDSNYTFYFPLEQHMEGERLEAVVLILETGSNEVEPVLYQTAYPAPFVKRELVLQ